MNGKKIQTVTLTFCASLYITDINTLVKFCFPHFPSEVSLFCLHFLCSAASILSDLDSLCLLVSLDSKMNVFGSIQSVFLLLLLFQEHIILFFSIFFDTGSFFKQLPASVFFIWSLLKLYP